MADTKRLEQLSKFRRHPIKNNHFFVSSLNISSGFVPQKLLDVIEGIFGHSLNNIDARII